MVSIFTPSDVRSFLSYIQLPVNLHHEKDIYFLSQLHVHMISAVPYENLTIHYSQSRTVDIDPRTVYNKIMTCRGRGGYCMEVSILYNHLLKALGFRVYTSAVRIRRRKDGVPSGPYTGWVHIVNIVTLADGSRWMVDVGFGGDGPTGPLPLVERQPQKNLGTQEVQLIRDHIPLQTDRRPETRLWIYQYRNQPHQAWNSFYAFSEAEAMEPDFGVMNWFTGSSPTSPQLAEMLVTKFLRQPKEGGRDGEQEIWGKRMLVGAVVKQNLGGKTQILVECRTETERIKSLQDYFAIELMPEEQNSVRGWRTALPQC